MPIGASGRVLNEMCSSRICVDGYGAGEFSGRVYNNNYPGPFDFLGVMGLLGRLERMFDGFEYPQRTTMKRRFSAAGSVVEDAVSPEKAGFRDGWLEVKTSDCGVAGKEKDSTGIWTDTGVRGFWEEDGAAAPEEKGQDITGNWHGERGRIATFYVKVVFRRNATWQGNILWLDKNERVSFRSVLELLFLMDSALVKK